MEESCNTYYWNALETVVNTIDAEDIINNW